MTTLQFLGATRMVTGSCCLVRHEQARVLIDCGLYQGAPEAVARNRAPFPFDPAQLDAVVLTHAHLDHTGLAPRLVAEGFRGRFITTAITKDLLPVLWEDFLRLQDEHDALYDKAAMTRALAQCEGHGYEKMIAVTPTCRVRLVDAGHILGSAVVELWVDDSRTSKKVVFSGDLGHRGKPIVRDPASVRDADVLILESTYGDRNHRSMADTKRELGEAIGGTLAAGGMVLMPVYAVGRSQDVLYMIHQLTLDGILDRPRVYLDSPMAIRSAHVYANHVEAFDEDALGLIQRPPKNPRAPHVQFTESAAASRALARVRGAVILAGSGMCEGGRIIDHLARHLDDPATTIIFTGYQVDGTLGRRLVDGVQQVTLQDRTASRTVAVKARIFTINGLSAHADQAGLLEWVSQFADPKPRVYLVHGEVHKMAALAQALERRLAIKAALPTWHEEISV